jgi:ATP-binding cassette subfamily B protein
MPSDLSPANGPTPGQLLVRLLGLTWRYRWGCMKILALQALILSFGLFGLGFTGIAVDVLRHAIDPAAPAPSWPFGFAPPAAWPPLRIIECIAAAVLVVALLRGVLDYLFRVGVNQLLQAEMVVHLRAEVYDKLQRLSFRFFDANASSTIIGRVTSDVQSTRMFVDQVLMQVVILILSLAAYLAYMLHIHVRLTLVCLSSTPLLWMFSARFSRLVQPAYRRNRELVDAMIQRLSENIRGILVVKAFAREQDEIARFRQTNETVREQKQWIFKRVAVFIPTVGFLSQVNLIILIGYGGYLAIRGEVPIGAGLLVFAGILQQFSGQISNIGTIANSMQECLTGARRVFEILDEPLEVQNPPEPVHVEQFHGAVRFENVWFDHGSDPVLQDLSFEALPGQSVGIFGATGSGKSALMSLIPRFYDPTAGRVLIDGHDLRDLDLNKLRRNVGLVFQESFLFSTTVAENIAFGHPEASRQQVENAARIAAAHDFITQLPQGYDTVLGEGGLGLSGGQRQRLAIARAVLLEPAILLLDDPTAAVDPGTEREIIAAMASAMTRRTTFIVAHRVSILRRTDFILVLDRGRIVQKGTHSELAAQPGYYREAATIQLAGAIGEPE